MSVTFQQGASYLFLICKARFPSVNDFVKYLQKKDLGSIKKNHTRVLHRSDCFYPIVNKFGGELQAFNSQGIMREVNSRLIPDNVHIIALRVENKNSISIAELKNIEARHLVSEQEKGEGIKGQLIVADRDDDSDSDSDEDY